MYSDTDPFIPTDSQIYHYLIQFHTGKVRPIKAKDLAVKFNITLRDVNEEIRQLRKAGVLVGSMKGKDSGYYIPANLEESQQYISAFKSELFDMLDTLNRQKRAQKTFADSFRYADLFHLKPDKTTGQLTFV